MTHDAYGKLVSTALFPFWETTLKGRATVRYGELLARTERASLDELAALQLQKLRRLLEHAGEHVPHYRDRFREAGFSPGDLRSLDDITRLPILARDEAQVTAAARTSTAPPFVAYRAVTGGTLGSALAFGYDADTEWWRKAAQLRAWGWAGYAAGDRVLYYVGDHHGLHAPPGECIRTALERALKREHYQSCMVRDESSLARAARFLRNRKPTALVCYPQAGADLARYMVETSHALEGIAVLCHGEKVYPADRAVMTQAFGTVFEMYAARETFMIAGECDRHAGLHIAMENVLVEVLVRDGSGTRPAVPGEPGEVVLTDLNNRAMPFIRYAIGDVAHGATPTPCDCGRTLPRLGEIEGRAVETLRGPEGQRISSTLFEQILMNALGADVKKFQIEQRRDGAIVLRVVLVRPLPSSAFERVERECLRLVPGLRLTIEAVPDLLPQASGKRRVVVVEER
jgi:phenylacetate-CoA ligase